MLTAEQFIYKLMEATEESYPEVSSVCFDFLENLSEDIEKDISFLTMPDIEQGYIPLTALLKAVQRSQHILVRYDHLEGHIEYRSDGEWMHAGDETDPFHWKDSFF
jgi:hypothetical protein